MSSSPYRRFTVEIQNGNLAMALAVLCIVYLCYVHIKPHLTKHVLYCYLKLSVFLGIVQSVTFENSKK